MRTWRIWMSPGFLLISLLASATCTMTSRDRVVVLPADRLLQPAYDAQGHRIEGRVTVSAGYLRELIGDLNWCRQSRTP